jgi:hypothetical protein
VNRGYGQDKRQRETERARKNQEKMARRAEKRDMGPGHVPIEAASHTVEASPSIEELMASMQRGPGHERAAATIPARLFVGGLSDEVGDEDLRRTFTTVGPVADVVVMRNRETGESRGFGFVTMADRRDANKAINELHGSELMGRSLVVNIATSRNR